jgi:hypothetical protein
MRLIHLVVWQILVLMPVVAMGQQSGAGGGAAPDEADAVHAELRALREALTKAVLEGDAETQLAHVHDNVVVTWQNNQVVRKAAGLKQFLGEMNAGDDRVFRGYKSPPTADEPTILYGDDIGIAFGSSVPQYKFLGMEFELENRWTAMLVKDQGVWKLAAYHVSGNLVDNPVLNAAKKSAYWAGGISLFVGLVLGRLFARKSQGDAPGNQTPGRE